MKAFVREKLSEIIRWPGFAALLVLVSVLMPCFIYWFHTGNSRGLYPGIRLDISGVQIQVDNGVIALIRHYDNTRKIGYGFTLDKFENKKIVSHMTAASIQYDTIADSKYHWKA